MKLLTARLGQNAPAIRRCAREIVQSTGGNPYFVDQLTENLDPEKGTLTSIPLQDVICGRLQRLPGEAALLLEVIAVSGHAISASEAEQAIGQATGTAFSTLNRMRNERLLRVIGADQSIQVDTYHESASKPTRQKMLIPESLEISHFYYYPYRF